jgi:hypothetical protein
MMKSLTLPLVGLSLGALVVGCNPSTVHPDAGPVIDVAPPPFDAGPPPGDAGPIHSVSVRLVNLIPASTDPAHPGGPNLTVCLATIPGTGIAPTTAHILGSPMPPVSDGTLPSPGVSPYLTVPLYAAPGFGYVLRLFDRASLPFSSLGECPDSGALVEVSIDGSMVTDGGHYTLAVIGVLPGTGVTCPGGTCPPVQARVFPDNLTAPHLHQFRARLFQGIPNLPGPIHVCVDPAYTVVGGVVMHGAEQRILPPVGQPGLNFGEVTGFAASGAIDPMMGMIQGAIYTHLSVAGVPDCDGSTLIQGPVTIPLPVPASAPVDVARTFKAGDVITNFAFGRAGAACTTAADCVAPTSVCVAAACTCDATHHCVDDLAGNTLPWRDVRGDLPVDAGMPMMGDAGTDGG